MTATKNYRVSSFVSGKAIKAPCLVATNANITLAGEQTVNSVAVEVGDRVLVKDQTDPIENGIYNVETSAWQRAGDWDGSRDATDATGVIVATSPDPTIYFASCAVEFTPGVDAVTFTVIDYETGSFAADWLGFGTSEQTTITYSRVGNTVTLDLGVGIQATSDSTTFGLASGSVPASIRPLRDMRSVIEVEDNGASALGVILTITTGQITLYSGPGNAAWTASGLKGFPIGQTFTYILN